MAIQIHDPGLDQRLKAAGASKTVYALVTPETEAVKTALLGNTLSEADAARRTYLEQFRDAWTGKQFDAHERFLETWTTWAAPLAAIDRAVLPWRYPTAGASEGLYHTIASYGHRARADGFVPQVHVFASEYEGYRAFAEACRIEVVEHPRAAWHDVARTLPPAALFCLSQPSAIDGNVWPEANAFLAVLGQAPRVLLDLTYVGAIAAPPSERIAASAPAVATVVFSLSKPFGVYYDRIGGVLSRDAMPSLFGNQWFKNLTSLQLGTALLQSHEVCDLPRRYRDVQLASARRVGAALGLDVRASDVYVLATAAAAGSDPALAAFLRRPPSDPQAPLRLCLTPDMALRIGTAGAIAGPPRSAGERT